MENYNSCQTPLEVVLANTHNCSSWAISLACTHHWLGVHDVYVNLIIVDEGGSSKNKSPTKLRIDSFLLYFTKSSQGI